MNSGILLKLAAENLLLLRLLLIAQPWRLDYRSRQFLCHGCWIVNWIGLQLRSWIVRLTHWSLAPKHSAVSILESSHRWSLLTRYRIKINLLISTLYFLLGRCHPWLRQLRSTTSIRYYDLTSSYFWQRCLHYLLLFFSGGFLTRLSAWSGL